MLHKNFIETLLEMFHTSNKPLQLSEISKRFRLISDSEEFQELKKILKDLCRQNILVKSSRRSYTLNEFESPSIIQGILTINKGRGVVEPELLEISKVTIKNRHLLTALDGDTVLIKLLPTQKNRKPRGEIIDIVERNQAPIIGTIDFDGSFYFLVPDEEKYIIDFLIPDDKLNSAEKGDKAAAKFLRWNDPLKNPKAEIIEIIGKAGDPTVEYNTIIREYNLPEKFPIPVIKEAEKFVDRITKKTSKGRLDLRNKEIITIDPEDAKDFDDALSLEILPNGNYLLGVHIADVSSYVKENSPIDIEARYRGTSIYLVDRVIPMLPENLSNNICSLKQAVDRLAFSVFMEFSKHGVLKNYEIKETIINNKRRFAYSEVQSIIESGKGDFSELILLLHKLASTLRKRRFSKGGIDFETFELNFILDENKYPVKAILKETNEANILVEEFMLAANRAIAAYIKKLAKINNKRTLPYIFRVHEEPDTEPLNDVLEFIASLGVDIKTKSPSSKDINGILAKIKDKNEKYLVHQILIRAMAKAVYSTKNLGHYGLGFDEYTHFTSPIRRYPDLIIHRIIKEYSKNNVSNDRIQFLKMLLTDTAKQATERERLSVEAERQSVKLTSTIMSHEFIGSEFDGTISGVTDFGLFVLLDSIYAEGLLHIRDLNDDYYYYDSKRYCLIGRNLKRVFRIGKRIRVRIINANIEKRRIDLAYIDAEN